jgi:hypothetical protein
MVILRIWLRTHDDDCKAETITMHLIETLHSSKPECLVGTEFTTGLQPKKHKSMTVIIDLSGLKGPGS